MTYQTSSTSSDSTEQLAETLGAKLRGGEVIELVSDLGGGKTAFVRGLARGMGSPDHVASPTFTISRVYKASELTLYHFDFYRLGEAGIMQAELAEILEYPAAVVAVEWAGVVENVLPDNKLTIRFERTGQNERNITMSYPPEFDYLIPEGKR